MADRISTAADQVQLFGMGFLLPGLVPVFALASINPAVAGWFGTASTSPTLAGVFFVVLGAIAVGFVINAVRFAFYERSYFGHCLVDKSPDFDMTKREQNDAAYKDLRQSHYYHYLAYANLSVSIPISALIWLGGTQLRANAVGAVALSTTTILIGVTVTLGLTYLLGLAGCEAVRRYNQRRGELLGFKRPPAA